MVRVKCVAAAVRSGQSPEGAVYLHDATLAVLGDGVADAPFVEGEEYEIVLVPKAEPEASAEPQV